MRFKRYLLTEKTFNVKQDVELLYNKGFKKFISIFQKYDFEKDTDKIISLLEKQFKVGYTSIFHKTDSSVLKTKDSQMAHEVNPVDIVLGVLVGGSFYRPAETMKHFVGPESKGLIEISLNINALETLMKQGLKQEYVPPSVYKNEFTPDRVKSAIAHELSHWISDTRYNFHISNLLKVARELEKGDIVLLHKKDVTMTHFELDAQIHAIKQIKSSHKKEWDSITLKDLFTLNNSLWAIGNSLLNKHGKDVVNIWQKALVKRMARENLLGKNMKKFVEPKDLK